MATRRQLINYLPPYLQDYRELWEVMAAEQPELDLLWQRAEEALSEQFILTAEDYGLSRWEQILQITPQEGASVEERRWQILARLNWDLPYTLPRLQQLLAEFCGEEQYRVLLWDYQLEVWLHNCSEAQRKTLQRLVRKMAPANLVLTLGYQRELLPPGTLATGILSEGAAALDLWPLLIREIQSGSSLAHGAMSEGAAALGLLPQAARCINATGEAVPSAAVQSQGITLNIYPQGGMTHG